MYAFSSTQKSYLLLNIHPTNCIQIPHLSRALCEAGGAIFGSWQEDALIVSMMVSGGGS
jgi:hypothetical protein